MTSVAMLISSVLYSTSSLAAEGAIKHSPGASITTYDESAFGADPTYTDKPYSAEAQIEIYGGKSAVQTPRPLVELGRDIYGAGQFNESSYVFGALNPTDQQFLVYGDWQTAVGYNDNGAVRQGVVTTRLRLDIDYKITSTERIHAFVNPLQKANKITRCTFADSKNVANDDKAGTCNLDFDLDLDALYFEGDIGAMISGATGEYSGKDIPFAVGFMPILFQNGIWVDDNFHGAAVTIPSLNSKDLDISNMDITLFTGWEEVNTGLADGKLSANIAGITTFIESNGGYWELGYGYTWGENDELDDQEYHNVTAAFSKRYGGWLSNTVRVIYNFGQNRNDNQDQTADGFLLLVENSFITSKPSTLIPYFNAFAGFDKPQPLAKGNGGVLLNTGINFETDNQTGFPKLDDTANDTWGGALGVEYLFGLDQQIVIEAATVQIRGDNTKRNIKGDQYALGIRYQKPLDKSWIFRADAMVGFLDNSKLAGNADKDLSEIGRASCRERV